MCSAVIGDSESDLFRYLIWLLHKAHISWRQSGILEFLAWLCDAYMLYQQLLWYDYSLKWRLSRSTSFLHQIEPIFIPPLCDFFPSLLTCCSMGLGLDPSGLCGRNSSSAGPLVSSCSRRRDFVPGGCSQWRTVSWCSNTQLQMASDVKLRSLRGKIWQKKTYSTMPVQSLSIHPKL